MYKHKLFLHHKQRITKAEVYLPAVLQVGWYVDHGGVRYRVSSIVVRTTSQVALVAHLTRLQNQPTANSA
jgi:hypothetical protein